MTEFTSISALVRLFSITRNAVIVFALSPSPRQAGATVRCWSAHPAGHTGTRAPGAPLRITRVTKLLPMRASSPEVRVKRTPLASSRHPENTFPAAWHCAKTNRSAKRKRQGCGGTWHISSFRGHGRIETRRDRTMTGNRVEQPAGGPAGETWNLTSRREADFDSCLRDRFPTLPFC